MHANPLSINESTPAERTLRNEQRMERLALAIAQTDNPVKRQALENELARRKQFGK